MKSEPIIRAPKRKFELDIKISGDTQSDVMQALEQILFAFEEKAGVRGQMVSGGVTSSWSVELAYSPNQTTENYHIELKKYLEFMRK